MTPEQEMQAIVEAAKEDWITYNPKHGYTEKNPSPTDLNELFRLAEKLGMEIRVNRHHTKYYSAYVFAAGKSGLKNNSDTPADALRRALFQAVKGESDG